MSNQITISELNNLFKNLNEFRDERKPVQTNTIHEVEEDGMQGDSNHIEEIYELNEDWFIKLIINSDSYGSNEFVNGIQFVKAVIKEVISYE